MKSQLFLTKHEYLNLNRAVVQTQRWAQSGSITSGVGPGFVFEESILRSLSCTRQEEKKAGCLSAQSHRSACSYPVAVAGEFVLLGHWETLAKEGKFSFPSQTQKETSLGDTGHTRVLGAFWSIIAFYNVSDTSLCDWPPSVCVCWVVWSPMAASSYQIAFWNFLFSLIIPY